jgi:hypothetical protein
VCTITPDSSLCRCPVCLSVLLSSSMVAAPSGIQSMKSFQLMQLFGGIFNHCRYGCQIRSGRTHFRSTCWWVQVPQASLMLFSSIAVPHLFYFRMLGVGWSRLLQVVHHGSEWTLPGCAAPLAARPPSPFRLCIMGVSGTCQVVLLP